jgi:signal transduction histidine kinase
MILSFRKRIATHFMLATALIILLVFGTVYFIVQESVYYNLDKDLSFEANKHLGEVGFIGDSIHFINMNEMKEIEHREIQVNPVFLQIVGKDGHIYDKSPNLKEQHLNFRSDHRNEDHFNAKLNQRNIRQLQIPIKSQQGVVKGYIEAAMSLDASLMVLSNLRITLLILFPIILIGLFFITSFLAGRSIIPVVSISETTNRITRNNLNERVALPTSKDELYDLSSSINSLLGRIQDAMIREQQFTSDASHELRTPLSVLRGTLEVLIRKPRTQEEYETKIQTSLQEIDRMALIIDQLLEIARFDSNPELSSNSSIAIDSLLIEIGAHRKLEITGKELLLVTDNQCDELISVHYFYGRLILDNILGNAIKYSATGGTIFIRIYPDEQGVNCEITDTGIGIKEEDLTQLFHPFFRSDALNHKEIKGTGLGLSIAQKAAAVIGASISISSEFGKGTSVNVHFKQILRNL